MRMIASLFLVCLAAPAASQTVVRMDFSQHQPIVPGVEVRSSSGFSEFRSGIWQVVAQSSVRSDKVSATIPAQDDSAETTHAGAPVAVPVSDACASMPVPPYVSGLEMSVARRRLNWWPVVSAAECRHGIPAGLLDALILQESQYRSDAVSPKGAVGMAQLMPATARSLGVSDRFDPVSNVDGGGRYLRAQLDSFQSIQLGLAAYNAGPGAVRSARGIPQNSETPGYVRRVLDYWSAASQDPMQIVRRTAVVLGFAPEP
jgi:soluble lytic murein transglycosylase-like protein